MKPYSESASIVLLGAFNPSIFTPAWLALKGLISEADLKRAEIKVIAPQVAAFSATGIAVEVLPERFTAQAAEPPDQVRMRDLVEGAFTILAETPLSKMGLNWEYTFRLESEARWHAVGDVLAPKQLWAEVLHGRPGLRALVIQGELQGELPGEVNVTVQPVEVPGNGVKVDVNHDIRGQQTEANADAFVGVLRNHWDASRRESLRIATEVLRLAGAP
jgi:hypothetical protein